MSVEFDQNTISYALKGFRSTKPYVQYKNISCGWHLQTHNTVNWDCNVNRNSNFRTLQSPTIFFTSEIEKVLDCGIRFEIYFPYLVLHNVTYYRC